MKAISLLLAAGSFVTAFGQTGIIAQGSVQQKDFGLFWQSRLEPPSPPMANSLGFASGTNRYGNIYRIMLDRSKRVYFGYEVHVEPLSQAKYRVTFQQLDLTPEVARQVHLDDPSGWSKLQLGAPVGRPLYPFRDAPDTVGVLDVIAVDLLMNPDTGQKIVDYVTLQTPNRAWSFSGFNQPLWRDFAYTPGSPRDYSAEDGALRLTEPHVSINGKLENDAECGPCEVSGSTLWIYLPNRGRYLLSLVPRSGLAFKKAGEVRGTSLTFTVGNDQFTVNSARPIVVGDAPFNLFVLNEPAWKPTYPHAAGSAFSMGVAEKADLTPR